MKLLSLLLLLSSLPIYADTSAICTLAIANDKSPDVTLTVANTLAAFNNNVAYLAGKIKETEIKIATDKNSEDRLKLKFTSVLDYNLVQEVNDLRERVSANEASLAQARIELGGAVQLQLSLLNTVSARLAMHKSENHQSPSIAATIEILHARQAALTKRHAELGWALASNSFSTPIYEAEMRDIERDIISSQGRQAIALGTIEKKAHELIIEKAKLEIQCANDELKILQLEATILAKILAN